MTYAQLRAVADREGAVQLPVYWSDGVTHNRCDTCDRPTASRGIAWAVVGHGDFCSLRCLAAWAGEPAAA